MQIAAAIIGLLIEFPILFFGLKNEDQKRTAFAILAVNLISHPIAWSLNQTIQLDAVWRIALIEIGVVILETILFRYAMKSGWLRTFLFFSIANAVSYFLGVYLLSILPI